MALWSLNKPERAYPALAELDISAPDRATLDQSLVPILMSGSYTPRSRFDG
jgi:hypothetical protein